MKKLKWVICDCCEGSGKTVHPALSNGFTSSEWADMPEEEQQAYMMGEYDVPCSSCTGSGKVQVPDVEAMSFKEKRQHLIDMRQSAQDQASDLAVWDRENRFSLG